MFRANEDGLRRIVIRHVAGADAAVWEKLRCELWPDGADDHPGEIGQFFAGNLDEPIAVLVAENASGTIVAFAELSIRTDLAGLEGAPVGYVEGLYVIPEFRHCGIARKLLQASRGWAHTQKCVTFASDRAGRIIIDGSF